ncbi:hypothetical protein L313_0741 [Acinetobacter haemolyticus CIP 64.3 = MTCC 9819]|nr:hypothetical protein L313_0741 [Acinetobacter haemolyticus CIP 64.3 = MTCC 9819]
MSPRSPSNCITIAVEVKTKPVAAINATCHVKPKRIPTPVNAHELTRICKLPRPNISRLRLHKCEGCISKPITNRYITIPNSAICRIEAESLKKAKPNGPMISPAIKYPRTEPSPILLKIGTAITAAANNTTGAIKLIE